VCTSPSYHFAAGSVPGNVRYVGLQLDNGGGTWGGPWAGADQLPLVLVGVSSTVVGQEDHMGGRQVRGHLLPYG